jgi:hypothetical protein
MLADSSARLELAKEDGCKWRLRRAEIPDAYGARPAEELVTDGRSGAIEWGGGALGS